MIEPLSAETYASISRIAGASACVDVIVTIQHTKHAEATNDNVAPVQP